MVCNAYHPFFLPIREHSTYDQDHYSFIYRGSVYGEYLAAGKRGCCTTGGSRVYNRLRVRTVRKGAGIRRVSVACDHSYPCSCGSCTGSGGSTSSSLGTRLSEPLRLLLVGSLFATGRAVWVSSFCVLHHPAATCGGRQPECAPSIRISGVIYARSCAGSHRTLSEAGGICDFRRSAV